MIMTDIPKFTDLPEEDQEAIRAALRQWRGEGAERPLIPLGVDLDGDGVTDAWGLDGDGEVVLVSRKALDDTVFFSDGGVAGTDDDDLSDVDLDSLDVPEEG